MITFDNFFMNTQASFKACKRPKREADYTSFNREGRVSSEYWYGEDSVGSYVIRFSDHWASRFPRPKVQGFGSKAKQEAKLLELSHLRWIASCKWFLKNQFAADGSENSCGKCYLKDFTRLS